MRTRQHPFHSHLFANKYFTYMYLNLKPVSFSAAYFKNIYQNFINSPNYQLWTSSNTLRINTINLPTIQTHKHLMPHKAFKLLNSQNFTSKLFKPSFKRNKKRNQECFLLVKKFHITTYCNTKKSSILQANKHQNKDSIDYNPSTPDSFHIYCSHSNNQKPNWRSLSQPFSNPSSKLQIISLKTSLCLNP